ncbi:CLOCK-interacting pacemaker [Leuresthes tenuis]|uniref:CLOCK-interacting pacemaker n=1 Tax=Leuresthes tenuis TaxID=355514 RepID=UPI003B501F3F
MSNKRKAESHLRAANRPHIMKREDSRADSERDSGFSDASSEHTNAMDIADFKDSRRRFVQQRPKAASSGPQPSQLAVVGGSYSGLSPMIIMNNVLLKQPVENPPAMKPWGFSPAMEVVQPVVQQPQVVFLQPVVSRRASSASKETTSRHRRSKKYFPILKSYPKIAPHPGDSASSSGRGTASSSSSSSGSERCSALSSNSQREKTHRTLSGSASDSGSATPGLPASPRISSPLLQSRFCLPATETSRSSSPADERPSSAHSQAELTTSLSVSRTTGSKTPKFPVSRAVDLENISSGDCSLSDGDSDSKRKRFCNTYNILNKSGLLDITLRTKELLRQNRRTQSDLDRLKEHTDLFLQALQSGDTSVCVKLQAILQKEDQERAIVTSFKAD